LSFSRQELLKTFWFYLTFSFGDKGKEVVAMFRRYLPNQHSLVFIFFLFGLVILIGCQAIGNEGSIQVLQSSIQFTWTHEYIFAPFYAAEKNGHFAEQNLEMEFLEGGFYEGDMISSIAEVVAGNADFGMANGYSIILAQAEGKPLVSIAVLLQRSPDAIISLVESNIVKPEDMVGKNISVSAGGATWGYNVLVGFQGLDASAIQVTPRTTLGIESLINQEVDGMMAWYINEGIALEESGYEANYILLSDYGVDTYPSIIFTTESIIAEKPELVERFLRALIAGMNDTLNDPKKAAELTMLYNNSLDFEEQHRRLQAALPYFKNAGNHPGMMDTAVWEATYQIMIDQGVLTTPLDIQAVYDLTFLNMIYQD
jgi:NitT/TauT family transport system substrate-binding protein